VVFAVVVGWFLLVIQCCVLGKIFPMEYKPDFTLLVVVWIGFKGDYVSGLFSVFLLGLFEDLLSGAPLGLFSVIYLTAFMFSAYISLNFDVERLGLIWFITIITCFASCCIVFLARWLGGQIMFEPPIIKFVIVKTILSSLGLILVKPLLDSAWKGYCRVIGAT